VNEVVSRMSEGGGGAVINFKAPWAKQQLLDPLRREKTRYSLKRNKFEERLRSVCLEVGEDSCRCQNVGGGWVHR
jgi:hypothetical protein